MGVESFKVLKQISSRIKHAVSSSLDTTHAMLRLTKGFVVDTEGLIRVFNELMNGERSVVGFDNGIGHLR